MSSPLLLENVWLQQQKFEDAELLFRETQSGVNNSGQRVTNTLAQEIAQVREDIQKVLNKQPAVGGGVDGVALCRRVDQLESENKKLFEITQQLKVEIERAIAALKLPASLIKPRETSAAAAKPEPTPEPQKAAAAADDDDDIDLFGSDDEEAKALKEKRVKEYAEKKAKKPVLIAKSSVVLDVKPWDDETDMVELEKRVRSVQQDGLVWGASKLVPVGYGINKLSIICVVEDDKVSIEDLSERITGDNEDLVQSVDISAFNKI
ncbi:unnamed protein product [Candidula unifasciata]|uniref:Translation elongation factor EF1B beta/delta subunit guanine nucleotide exchange domain-containing protein n=1 Tax=Candidula unifasciata TaxID=100452 RepID=A0A8S3ZUD8_9EUPU|nr:unnamed protein product [Candidula unifasciata]